MRDLLTQVDCVQLQHIPEETPADHGFVRVKAYDGAELAFSQDLQHNRKYGMRGVESTALLEKAKAQDFGQRKGTSVSSHTESTAAPSEL